MFVNEVSFVYNDPSETAQTNECLSVRFEFVPDAGLDRDEDQLAGWSSITVCPGLTGYAVLARSILVFVVHGQ
jgi:hypothetical protein